MHTTSCYIDQDPSVIPISFNPFDPAFMQLVTHGPSSSGPTFPVTAYQHTDETWDSLLSLLKKVEVKMKVMAHMDLGHVHVRGDPITSSHIFTLHRQCQIFRHDTINVNRLYTCLF